MAIVANQNEEDPNQSGGTPVSGTAGASDSGNPSAGVNGASPVKQNAAAQNQSGYTDVGSYLNANREGSSKMGQDVASNLTNRYNQTKQGVQSSANDLINQVNQGYTKENTDLIKQVAADPNAAASNNDTLSQFQGQLNDTYKGPSDWGDYGTQQGKVNEATQYGSLNKTKGGTNVLAQELEGQKGSGQASQGVNQLDSLLLQGDPNAQASIQAASDPYQGLNDYLGGQKQAAGEAIKGGQTAAQNASQHALDAFTGANGTLTNLNSQVNAETQAAQAKAKTQNDAINAGIKGLYNRPVDTAASTITGYHDTVNPWVNTTNYTVGDLDPSVLSSLGMTPDQWQALKGGMQNAGTSQYFEGHNFGAGSGTSQLDLGQFYTPGDLSGITPGTVGSKDEYDKFAAISKLLGDKTPQGMALNPAMASQAGTAPAGAGQFNYQAALKAAQDQAASQRAQAQAMASGLSATADQLHGAEAQHGWGAFFDRNLPNAAKYVANPLLLAKPEIQAAQNAVR